MILMRFATVFAVFSLFFSVAAASENAQDLPSTSLERFAGEGRIASQPPFPLHLDLRRSGDVVTGTVSSPRGSFELSDAKGRDTIVGCFRGTGGTGALTLHLRGDGLAGEFDLEGQPGTITTRRTAEDAQTFFKPPEQRLALTTDEWLKDLDRLIEILMREHASLFHRVSPERFQREAARIRAAIPTLDGATSALEFHKLGAIIGDGHTSVALPHGGPHFPIELYWFEDGLRVIGASGDLEDLVGSRLVSVNDIPAMELAERFRLLVPQGETQSHHRVNVPELFARPHAFKAVGLDTVQTSAFTFEAVDGTRKQIELTTAAAEEDRITLGEGQPLWQRNETRKFWSEVFADGSVYVNWRSYEGLAANSGALLGELDIKHPRRLIIDLRDNSGGDFNAGRILIDEIRSRPWFNRHGILYVLIGRNTFSAAMTNAVDFKTRTEATLVGEPAGAAPNNWQEARRFFLSNSGLRVSVATRYYQFLPNWTELRPDHVVPPVPSDWGVVEDAATRFILNQPLQ